LRYVSFLAVFVSAAQQNHDRLSASHELEIANAKGVLSAKRILEGTISCVMAIEKDKLLLAGRELDQIERP